MKCAFIKTSQ